MYLTTLTTSSDRVPDIAEQLISQAFRLREDDEYQRNGDEQLQAHHNVTPYARQKISRLTCRCVFSSSYP